MTQIFSINNWKLSPIFSNIAFTCIYAHIGDDFLPPPYFILMPIYGSTLWSVAKWTITNQDTIVGLRLFVYEPFDICLSFFFLLIKLWFQYIRKTLLCDSTDFTWIYRHHTIVDLYSCHRIELQPRPNYPDRCAKFSVSQICVGIVALFVSVEMYDLMYVYYGPDSPFPNRCVVLVYVFIKYYNIFNISKYQLHILKFIQIQSAQSIYSIHYTVDTTNDIFIFHWISFEMEYVLCGSKLQTTVIVGYLNLCQCQSSELVILYLHFFDIFLSSLLVIVAQ